MAFDPIYIPDSDKETPKNKESDSKDEPPRFSPKIIFIIIGLLIGAVMGYGLSQVFVTPQSEIENIPQIIESNDDELNDLKNELDNTKNEIQLLEAQLSSFQETKDLLSTTQKSLQTLQEELNAKSEQIALDLRVIDTLRSDLEDTKESVLIANARITELERELFAARAEQPAPEPEPAPAAPAPAAPAPAAPAPAAPAPEPELNILVELGEIQLYYGTGLIPVPEPITSFDAINIETNVTNTTDEIISAIWLLTITDSEGNVVHEGLVVYPLQPNQQNIKLSNSWTPTTSGEFVIEVVIVDNYSDKNPISQTQTKTITISI